MFSEKAATRAINFFQKICVHIDGKWAGQPFLLMDWQRDLIRTLFGTLNEDGSRQYRTCYVEIPRKNGKSETAAGMALYLLVADSEPGAQVYGAAGHRDQAGIVYRVASEMTKRSPYLSSKLKVIDSTKRILLQENASFYRAIPAEAATSHGFNASGVIVDEVHVQPNRDLIDVLITSTGARRQPLTFYITTAGSDRNSICWEIHDYALKVKNGVVTDPTFLPLIFAADEADDWTAPETWRKANPSLGITVSEDFLANECKRAQDVPAYQNTFRRLYLNQWTSQDTRWLDLAKWDACGEPVDLDRLKGRTCFAGLDLASTTDIAALVLAFPDDDGTFDILPYFWIPGDNIQERVRRDRVPYDLWARQGLVIATEGNVIDYKSIRLKIEELAGLYRIKDLGFDRWGATQLTQELTDAGIEVVGIGQGFASMTAPTKELLNIVLSRRLRHGGNPVLRWMADNMVVATDPAGNIKPNKGKSTERIDGIVALVMSLDRATRNVTVDNPYESRGMLVL